jgi:hypothetical protein
LPARLDWNVGQSEPEGPGLDDLEQPGTSAPPPRRPWRPSPLAFVAYVGALLVAGWLGFYLGRESVAKANYVLGLETALALEEMAWEDADLDLYMSTIDPEASGAWRDSEARRFKYNAPTEVDLELVTHEPSGENQALVRVRFAIRGEGFDETRPYRFLGDVWARSGAGYPEGP